MRVAMRYFLLGLYPFALLPVPLFLPRSTVDLVSLAHDDRLHLAHLSRPSSSASRSRSVPATSVRKACAASSAAATEDGALAAPSAERSIRASAISIRPKAFLLRSPSIWPQTIKNGACVQSLGLAC